MSKRDNSGFVFFFAVAGMLVAISMKQSWYALISLIVFLLVFGITTILAGFVSIPTIMVLKIAGGTLLTLNCLSILVSIYRVKSNWARVMIEAEILVEDL